MKSDFWLELLQKNRDTDIWISGNKVGFVPICFCSYLKFDLEYLVFF